MSTDFIASAASDSRPAASSYAASNLSVNHGMYEIAAALVIGDTIALCKLPSNHIIVDCVLSSDQLDVNGTPTIELDVGIIGDDTDAFIDGSDVAQTGGIARMNSVAGRILAKSNTDRNVGVLVTVAPATGAASGRIELTLITRSAGLDD